MKSTFIQKSQRSINSKLFLLGMLAFFFLSSNVYSATQVVPPNQTSTVTVTSGDDLDVLSNGSIDTSATNNIPAVIMNGNNTVTNAGIIRNTSDPAPTPTPTVPTIRPATGATGSFTIINSGLIENTNWGLTPDDPAAIDVTFSATGTSIEITNSPSGTINGHIRFKGGSDNNLFIQGGTINGRIEKPGGQGPGGSENVFIDGTFSSGGEINNIHGLAVRNSGTVFSVRHSVISGGALMSVDSGTTMHINNTAGGVFNFFTLSNNGTMIIDSNTTLNGGFFLGNTTTGLVTQNNGTVITSVTNTGTYQYFGGSIQGNALATAVQNAGIFSVRDFRAITAGFGGAAYLQANIGIFNPILTNSTNYGRLTFVGNGTVHGIVRVSLTNPVEINNEDIFDVLINMNSASTATVESFPYHCILRLGVFPLKKS